MNIILNTLALLCLSIWASCSSVSPSSSSRTQTLVLKGAQGEIQGEIQMEEILNSIKKIGKEHSFENLKLSPQVLGLYNWSVK